MTKNFAKLVQEQTGNDPPDAADLFVAQGALAYDSYGAAQDVAEAWTDYREDLELLETPPACTVEAPSSAPSPLKTTVPETVSVPAPSPGLFGDVLGVLGAGWAVLRFLPANGVPA